MTNPVEEARNVLEQRLEAIRAKWRDEVDAIEAEHRRRDVETISWTNSEHKRVGKERDASIQAVQDEYDAIVELNRAP